MATRPYQAMSKAELVAEIRRLQDLVEADADLERVVQELEESRNALRAQQTKVIESQRQLEESLARYSDLFDFAPITYVLLDEHGVVKDINLTGAVLLGTERGRFLEFPFRSFVLESERRTFLDYFARCRHASEAVEAELTLRARDGRLVPVHVTTKRFASTIERVAFHMAIVDVTERKRVVEERQRAEQERQRMAHREQLVRAASEAKDRFLAVLSHELRTPLTPILFALASVQRAGLVPEALAPTVDMIRRNVELEARLIDDLLDVTRITQGKLRLTLESVDAHAVVEEVVGLCAEEVRAAGLRVVLELHAAVHHVRGDATRLRQVFWNLLKNAVHHTAAGGYIVVRSENETDGRLRLEVRDTGVGMSAATLANLFQPFEQGTEGGGRSAGLGLGLAICRGIMEAHGGSISASSGGDGRGASFVVELETTAPAAAALPPPKRPVRAAASPKKILLVEDNRDNATAIAELLQLHGYDVDIADSVEMAVKHGQRGFDVLVSDIGLPDGTGRDVVRRLTTHGPVRAIALTGYGRDEDVRSNADAGFSRHLTKPVDPDELLVAISELTDSNGPTSSAVRPRRA